MDEFGLVFVFLLFASTTAQSFVTISHTHSRFEIHQSGKVTQRIYAQNDSVTYDASLESLQLLRNTRILGYSRSCVINEQYGVGSNKTRSSHQNVKVSTERVTFSEVAKVTRSFGHATM